MKKLFFLFLLACSTNVYSQWTDGDTIPDFTLNDLEGNPHNLYSLLNDGKVVLLDFFFPACSPCWNDSVKHGLKDVNSFYGPDGSNQIRTFGINTWGGVVADPNINGVDISNQNLARGDYQYSANYPIMPQGSDYADSVRIQYAPTYLLVCPDKRAYDSYHVSLVSDASSLCNVSLAKTKNKVRIYVPEISTCYGFNHVNVYGHLRNTGSNTISSARVKLVVNNTVLSTQNLTFTGNNTTSSTLGLPEFKFDNILIDQPMGEYGKGPYKIVVDMINGINVPIPFEKIIKIKTTNSSSTSKDLNVELKTDKYSVETSWVVYNAAGDIVAQNPGLQNSTISYTNITLSDNECYTLRLKDSQGDGIDDDGYLKLKTPSNAELCNLAYGTYNYENFGYDIFHSFAIGSLSNVASNEVIKLSVYPNPTSDKFIVETSEKVAIDIVDLNGKIIRSIKNADNTMPIDISDLKPSVYLVNIKNAKTSQLIKIVKN